MVLGTVELGLDYGINNSGKPSHQQAFELLDTAWDGGIREIDTAAAYGDAEEIIGLYQKETGHCYQIDTKLPVSVNNEMIEASFESSCKKLNSYHINLLYIHSFKQCKDSQIIKFLEKMKKEGRVIHLGISIYEPSEMEYIVLELPEIDTIQFPYNLFDNHRWEDNNLLDRAINSGKRLYARSIFLQGLFFKDATDEFVHQLGASYFVKIVHELASNAVMSVAELAYKYVAENSKIDSVILGCQKKEEVIMNLALEKSEKKLDKAIRKELDRLSKNASTNIIDPRRWPRK